eukprot:1607758-Rhodomonas_salina.1
MHRGIDATDDSALIASSRHKRQHRHKWQHRHHKRGPTCIELRTSATASAVTRSWSRGSPTHPVSTGHGIRELCPSVPNIVPSVPGIAYQAQTQVALRTWYMGARSSKSLSPPLLPLPPSPPACARASGAAPCG